MKKYIPLISVLALAACASGGSGPDDRFRVASSSKYVYASDAAVKSNQELTSMASEVVICNGTCPTHLDRITGTPSHARVSTTQQGGTELTVYDLSDVTFTIADEDFTPGEESFTFVVDDTENNGARGKIIGIDMGFGEEDSFPVADKNPILTRKGDNTVFDGYVNDPDDSLDQDKWKPAKYTYESLGKNRLRFSDFGTLRVERTDGDGKTWTPVFIGGYDEAKKIDPTSVSPQTLNFVGTASGSVVAILNGQGSGTSIDLNDNNAKLTLTVDNNNAVSSEMTAKFNNWYDVAYAETGASKNIVLSNYQGTDDYKMLTAADGDGKVTIQDTGIKSDIRYFGDNGTPSEAVGIIQVRDCGGGTCTNDYGTSESPNPEVRMNVGFGVTKQ